MPRAAKRKRPGPAPGTGGRPASPETRSTSQVVVRLWLVDEERLERVRAMLGGATAGDALRRALEMADDMLREPTGTPTGILTEQGEVDRTE